MGIGDDGGDIIEGNAAQLRTVFRYNQKPPTHRNMSTIRLNLNDTSNHVRALAP